MGVQLIFLAPHQAHQQHPTVIRSSTSLDDPNAMAPFVEVSNMETMTTAEDGNLTKQAEEPSLSANRVKCRMHQMGALEDDEHTNTNMSYDSRGLPNPMNYKAPSFSNGTATHPSVNMSRSQNVGIALSRRDSLPQEESDASSSCCSDPEEDFLQGNYTTDSSTSIELSLLPSLAVSSDEDNSITEREDTANNNRQRHDSIEDVHDVAEDECSFEEPDASKEQDREDAPSSKEELQQVLPPIQVSSSLSDSTRDELSFPTKATAEEPKTPSTKGEALKSCFKTKETEADKPNKQVSFDSISVHYHSVGLGDSPSVSKGPPLALTWQRIHLQVYSDVEHYEDDRPELKGKKKMRLKSSRREKILSRSGVSEEEIQRCIATIEQLKKEHEDDLKTVDEDLLSCEQRLNRDMQTYIAPVPTEGVFCSSPSEIKLKEWLWLDWVCR